MTKFIPFRNPLSISEKLSGDFNPDELFSAREVAEFLHVDETTVRRYLRNGAMKAVLLPSSGKRQTYMIRKVDVYNSIRYEEEANNASV